jgi:hypothetical protein
MPTTTITDPSVPKATGIWWPFRYAVLAIKQNPWLLISALVVPLIADSFVHGSLHFLCNFCFSVIPLLFLSISAMRLAARDFEPTAQIAEKTRWSMIWRMIFVEISAIMIPGAIFLMCTMGAMLTRPNTPPPSSHPSPPKLAGFPDYLSIQPTLVANHHIAKGDTIKDSDISIEDVNFGEDDYGRPSYKPIIHNRQTAVGHIAVTDIAAGKPIEPDSLGVMTTNELDPIPKTFDTSIPHKYFANPVTKKPMSYGFYRQEVRSTQPIAKGFPISAINVEKVYVPQKVNQYGWFESPIDTPGLNGMVGQIAAKDIPANATIRGDCIATNPANATFQRPDGLTLMFFRIQAYTFTPMLFARYLVWPVIGGIAWCFLYIRFCLTSALVCLEGTGLARGALRSWQLTRGATWATVKYYTPFMLAFWLVPTVLASGWWLAFVVGHTFGPPNADKAFGALTLIAEVPALAWGILSAMLFNIIVVLPYIRLKAKQSQAALAPSGGKKPQPTVLGCGHDHSQEGPHVEQQPATDAAQEEDQSIILNIKKRAEEQIE